MCTNLIELDTKEGEPLTCGKCSTVCSSKKDLVQHMTTNHINEKNFGCPQCDYKAKSQLLITKHVRRLHKKERKHTCNICGKSFFEKWNLTDHIVAVHQKKKPYVCDKCGKAFSQKSGLSSHNTFQHPDPNKVHKYSDFNPMFNLKMLILLTFFRYFQSKRNENGKLNLLLVNVVAKFSCLNTP